MFIMAVNVGNPSAHSPQHSFKAGPVLRCYSYPQIMSLSPSGGKWPQLVQNSAGRFRDKPSLLGLWKSSSAKFSKSIVAVQVQVNGRAQPPRNSGNVTLSNPEAIEDSPLISISEVTPISEQTENLVKNSVPLIQLCQGEFLENRMLYRQKYVIRSYQVGADKATSITTIFGLFQDASLCYFHFMGLAARDGFGATNAMDRLGLIWVVGKMHVEVESFPKWPDVIEIDTSIARAGKNGMRLDWIVRRHETNEVLVRATSIWCMMDSTTRRVCKMPDAARAELRPFFWDDRHVFLHRDQDHILSKRITKLDNLRAKYMISALKSSKSDLDVNQHVTNSSYIGWILQSVPEEHMDTHNLASITIEYRRECRSEDIFESLTSSKKMLEEIADPVPAEGFVNSGLSRSEFTHLLRTQDLPQQEIARARTAWVPKPSSA